FSSVESRLKDTQFQLARIVALNRVVMLLARRSRHHQCHEKGNTDRSFHAHENRSNAVKFPEIFGPRLCLISMRRERFFATPGAAKNFEVGNIGIMCGHIPFVKSRWLSGSWAGGYKQNPNWRIL